MEQRIIIGLITFFLGLILGHRLSLGRDKRKEFNDLTKDIYSALNSQIKNRTEGIVHIDLVFIEPYINIFERQRFRDRVARYTETEYKTGEYDVKTSSVTHNEPELDKLVQHAKDILPYFCPR